MKNINKLNKIILPNKEIQSSKNLAKIIRLFLLNAINWLKTRKFWSLSKNSYRLLYKTESLGFKKVKEVPLSQDQVILLTNEQKVKWILNLEIFKLLIWTQETLISIDRWLQSSTNPIETVDKTRQGNRKARTFSASSFHFSRNENDI